MTRGEQVPATIGMPRNEVVPLPRVGRKIASVLVVLIGALVIYSITTNPRFGWDVVGEYFFSKPILDGLLLTLWLTAASMIIGSIAGLLLALMRLSPSRLLRWSAGVYIWIFRGTPLLVLVILLYNISYLYPNISLTIPFGPELFSVKVNVILTPTLAAIIAFSLNEAAFICEVFRGGLLSVNGGQLEAAQSLGMRRSQVLKRILLPQAMRSIIPPYGNQVISMLKATSLVSVISSADLLYAAQTIYAENYQTVPLLIVAVIWYLILTSILTVIQGHIERRYGRGFQKGNDR